MSYKLKALFLNKDKQFASKPPWGKITAYNNEIAKSLSNNVVKMNSHQIKKLEVI